MRGVARHARGDQSMGGPRRQVQVGSNVRRRDDQWPQDRPRDDRQLRPLLYARAGIRRRRCEWLHGARQRRKARRAHGRHGQLLPEPRRLEDDARWHHHQGSDGFHGHYHERARPRRSGGEQPDHDMHLATGALVYDIVNEDAKWKICVPQKYFYDYQTWNDDVNVIPEVETLQRYAWLRLSQAIYAYDATILFWSEHAINLGRTYIRRSIDASASSC
ncbi:hypothetical protein Ae201684P_016538 [Aphanomyces euteiches]|uniref:Uncharacterized protein n=1 Tax=Aphanomyces euteiches TaxID=100861 RepID=A0A6G0WEW6_9STRA|nr:hypothetical protein Ae201684_015691 [Aphanomyces euteiches]KAH9093918.1 hypothetical protein Ae201684P_016538 [Aphanomyces euteiches]